MNLDTDLDYQRIHPNHYEAENAFLVNSDYEEREIKHNTPPTSLSIKERIPMLRQYLNERPAGSPPLIDEDLMFWLGMCDLGELEDARTEHERENERIRKQFLHKNIGI